LDAIGQLAGGIAHDFNNMLAAMHCAADLIRVRTAEERSRHLAQSIVTSVDRAAGLTAKLLAFSRKGRVVNVAVDMAALAAETAEMLCRSIDPRVEVRVEGPSQPCVVSGDPSLLQNLLLNLGINARDAMPDGGRLVFSVEPVDLDPAAAANVSAPGMAVVPGRHVRVQVADTGHGMEPAVLARIFEPFFTTKEVGKGTGLGLAAAYGTVKDHHGAIRVTSAPGAGSTFTIHLPAAPEGARGSSVRLPAIRPGSGTVLVVDDEELLRTALAALVADLGYAVVAVPDGAAAEARYRAGGIDIVLLDQVMPGRSGAATWPALRAIDPRAVVILCSGYPRHAEVGDLLDEGLFAYLVKPVGREALADALARASEERRRRTQAG
jgi:CheY-like chemotaxis protein